MSTAREDDFTGRDDYIIGQALTIAIHYLNSLPESYRPQSDIWDMGALLIKMGSRNFHRHRFELLQKDLAEGTLDRPTGGLGHDPERAVTAATRG